MIRELAGAVCIAAAAALLAVAPAARAVVLLGNDFVNGSIRDVDPVTGLASNPRPTNISTLSDIEHDPLTGTLWGLAQLVSGPTVTHALMKIDIATGLATVVGATGLNVFEGDLALDPVTGTLYGIQHQNTARALQMFTVDKTTGVATIVGTVAGTDLSAMSFDNAGNLFILDSGAERLLRVDEASGAILGSVGLSVALGTTAGMDVDPSTGVMYVADGFDGGTDALYTLNTATGFLDLIGSTGLESGLAGLTVLSNRVPVPGTLPLFALACAGAVRCLRSRVSAESSLVPRRRRRTP